MAYHIIGLDLGTCAVKAVVIERSFRGYEVKGTRSVPVPQNGSSMPTREAIWAAASELVDEFDSGAVGYVVGYPGRKVASWFVPLPFADHRRVSQTLPFELENYVPFELEDMVMDYRVCMTVNGQTRVLAALANRDDVRSMLSSLKNLRVDPRALPMDSYALAYAPPGKETPGQAIAIIDIGHTQTLVTVRYGTHPDFIRTIPLGGLHVTQELMSAFGVNYRTAELIKARMEPVDPLPDETYSPELLGEEPAPVEEEEEPAPQEQPSETTGEIWIEHPTEKIARTDWFSVNDLEEAEPVAGSGVGFGGENDPLGSDDEKTASFAGRVQTSEEIEAIVTEAMKPLIREIRNALMAYEGGNHREVSATLLVGGGALLKGLPEIMTEELGVPADRPQRLGPEQVVVDSTDQLPRYALPFTLAYLGATEGKIGEINFRQGEFSYQKSYLAMRRYMVAAVVLAMVGLLVAVSMFFTHMGELARESAQLNEQITSAIQEGFPDLDVDPSRGIDRPLALMLEEHMKLKEKGKLMGLGAPRSESLNILRELSSSVPSREEVTLDVDDYTYGGGQVKMRGTADSFEAIEKIEKAIGASPFVDEVKSDEGSKGSKKSFNFVITLSEPEEEDES